MERHFKNYYKPQWQLLIDYLQAKLDGKNPKQPDYFTVSKKWISQTLATDPYSKTPKGDPITIAKELLKKYGPLLDK